MHPFAYWKAFACNFHLLFSSKWLIAAVVCAVVSRLLGLRRGDGRGSDYLLRKVQNENISVFATDMSLGCSIACSIAKEYRGGSHCSEDCDRNHAWHSHLSSMNSSFTWRHAGICRSWNGLCPFRDKRVYWVSLFAFCFSHEWAHLTDR